VLVLLREHLASQVPTADQERAQKQVCALV
jgi:hypothetical protein